MRILFLTQWFHPEPGAVRGLPLATALQAAGDRVEVITGFPNYPGGRIYPGYRQRWRRREEIVGVPVLRVPLYPSHDANAWRRMLNYTSFAASAASIGLLSAQKADLGYVYHPPPTVGLAAACFRLFRRLPFVYHIADMWPESLLASDMIAGDRQRALAGRLIARGCDWVYRQAACITVLSPGFKRLLVERGVPASKIEVVYNWVEEDVFQPQAPDRELRGSLAPPDSCLFLYAGNLGAVQGLTTVIRAAALVRDNPRIRIVLAGTGQRQDALRALAAELRADNVSFLGRREYWEMPRLHACADILLVHLRDLPFFAATIPSKTQVALASARPILMAVRGDAAELVRRADAGLACAPEDPDAMAATMRAFAAMDAERRRAMGERGRAFYLQELSLARGASRMQDIFRAVAAASAGARGNGR